MSMIVLFNGPLAAPEVVTPPAPQDHAFAHAVLATLGRGRGSDINDDSVAVAIDSRGRRATISETPIARGIAGPGRGTRIH